MSARTNSEKSALDEGEIEESYSEIHTITNERQLFDAQFNSVEQIGEGQGNLYLFNKALNFLRMGVQFIGVIKVQNFSFGPGAARPKLQTAITSLVLNRFQ